MTNHIFEQLSNIPEINYGGCGLVAFGLYKYLKKQNTKKQLYITFIEEWDYIDEFDEDYIMEGNACGVGHVMLFYDGKYYDALGKYDNPFECSVLNEFESEPEFIDIKENIENFMNCALFGKGWNNQWNYLFERDKHIKTIENILKISFD